MTTLKISGIFFLAILFFQSTFCQNDSVAVKTETAKSDIVTRVTNVYEIHKHDSNAAGLGNYIVVETKNLDSLLKESIEKKRPIILYLDNVPMNIEAEYVSEKDDSLIFKLTRNENSMKLWAMFYHYPVWKHFTLPVSVSVGLKDGSAVETDVKKFTLILVRKGQFIGALIGIAALIIFFIWLGKKSDLLRDDIFGDKVQNPNEAPFSLSRAQMAFWTILVVISYIYVWVVTGELTEITGSTLVMLGISIGTSAGAQMVNVSHKESGIITEKSNGFWMDILSDSSGVSIHRFQMVVWTLLFGMFFIRYVTINLAMPQFDENLLALMGISSGAYIGLKIPENKTK